MTKFITYYNLCPIHDPTDFLGISADREEGNIITTLGKNIIVVIQISNQKQIRSWSTLEKLSSKVVYDHKSQKYVGVFASRAIRCWDELTSDINKCKKLKFYKKIADLVSYEETTLVIYMDGTCEDLATAIQSRKNNENVTQQEQLSLNPGVLISSPKVSSLSDGRKCLTFFEKHQKNNEMILVKIDLDKKTSENPGKNVKKFLLKRENLDVNVAGYAVIDGDDAPMLLTIWSDKRLFLLNLNNSVAPAKSPGNFVSMLNALKVDIPLSIIGISKHFIAIYGANSSQEGASLLLYNTQFKVIKAKQFFKIYFNFSRLWAIDASVLLAMGQNLSVVSYQISKELLSEFVGTQSSNDFQTAIENDHINEEDPLQESIQYTEADKCINFGSNAQKNKSAVLKLQFADGKSCPYEAPTDFDKNLNALSIYNMHVDIVQVDNAHEDFQINLMTNANDNGFLTKEVQLIAGQLENCGASEHEITEKLLFVLIQSNLIQDIAFCFRRYTNISEKMIAKTLKYVLNNISSTINDLDFANTDAVHVDTHDITSRNKSTCTGEVKEQPNADIFLEKYLDIPTVKTYADVLNVVLSCSFDAEAIASHVRREIDYPQVLFILGYLYNILTKEHSCYTEMRGFGKDCIEIEMQIFRWLGVFLNTHFQKLALSKDALLIDILCKWHALLTVYKTDIEKLEQVGSLLLNIVQQKKVSKENNYSKWYSIEEVDLY